MAAEMAAATSPARACTRTTSDSLKGLRLAAFFRVFAYNRCTTQETLIYQICENLNTISALIAGPFNNRRECERIQCPDEIKWVYNATGCKV